MAKKKNEVSLLMEDTVKVNDTNIESVKFEGETEAPAPAPVKPKRVFTDNVEIIHDLYKLEVASFKKNISFEEDAYNLINMEHTHTFHNYDSNGRKMLKCNAVGGHYHEVTTFMDSEGNLTAECGPCKGKLPVEMDKHTHKISYQRSNTLKPAKMNAEAVKTYAAYDRPLPTPAAE